MLDDYGSFLWTHSKESTSDNLVSSTNSENYIDAKDEEVSPSDRSTPFNINDWLVVVDDEYEDSQKNDNSADDGSSIVVLSMYD